MTPTSLLLGNIMDHHELINVEYKEFCFKTNLFNLYSKKDLNAFIVSSFLLKDFNELIIKNIKKYIYVYVPRYVSAFHNSNFDEKYLFYIGINDYSEITGIPFNGNLKIFIMYIKSYIKRIVKENVKDICCIKIDCEIIENEIDTDILSDDYLQDILRKYNEEKQRYQQKYNKYILDKKDWIGDILFFKGKLQDVINNQSIKINFVEFLENKNLLNSFPEVYKDTHSIPSNEVKFVKNNPNNMIYWLIKFKDEKMKNLMIRKPVDPPIPKILNIDYCILTKMSALRKRLVDRGVRYYTIKITFTCKKNCSTKIAYIDPRTRQIRRLTRYICPLKQSPRCIDI